MKHILLITGNPGVGKTTLIRRAVESLGGLSIAGFYTEEIRKGGGRQGFRLVTFSGASGVIAHVNFSHRYTVGKYGVNVDAIDRFAESALALTAGTDLYIVDEIGKMECYSSCFVAAIQALVHAEKPLVATITKKGAGLIEEMKHRPEQELWEVTPTNRDTLVADIVAWVRNRL
jgi:nucleoside-triphosphatase